MYALNSNEISNEELEAQRKKELEAQRNEENKQHKFALARILLDEVLFQFECHAIAVKNRSWWGAKDKDYIEIFNAYSDYKKQFENCCNNNGEYKENGITYTVKSILDISLNSLDYYDRVRVFNVWNLADEYKPTNIFKPFCDHIRTIAFNNGLVTEPKQSFDKVGPRESKPTPTIELLNNLVDERVKPFNNSSLPSAQKSDADESLPFADKVRKKIAEAYSFPVDKEKTNTALLKHIRANHIFYPLYCLGLSHEYNVIKKVLELTTQDKITDAQIAEAVVLLNSLADVCLFSDLKTILREKRSTSVMLSLLDKASVSPERNKAKDQVDRSSASSTELKKTESANQLALRSSETVVRANPSPVNNGTGSAATTEVDSGSDNGSSKAPKRSVSFSFSNMMAFFGSSPATSRASSNSDLPSRSRTCSWPMSSVR